MMDAARKRLVVRLKRLGVGQIYLCGRSRMLARREDEMWSLTPHEDRSYSSDVEEAFFDAIEHPQPPTDELCELFKTYGKFTNN